MPGRPKERLGDRACLRAGDPNNADAADADRGRNGSNGGALHQQKIFPRVGRPQDLAPLPADHASYRFCFFRRFLGKMTSFR
jgi:hypothetical protein